MVFVGYGSHGNEQKTWEKVESMVCHSDHKYLAQILLLAKYDFSESEQ